MHKTYRVRARALILASTVVWLQANAACAEHSKCSVIFAVSVTQPMATLDFTIDYDAAQGTFVHQPNRAHCRSAVDGGRIFTQATCEGSYGSCQWGEGRKLSVGMTFDAPVAGPVDVAACDFETDSGPSPDDFVAETATATDENAEALSDLPKVAGRAVECR